MRIICRPRCSPECRAPCPATPPTLPTIITNFALLIIGLWGGATITETVFLWPGLGRTIYQAIGLYDIPVIVGSTIIFPYLLAATVFLLDFIYALVDPRVKIGGN